MAAPQILRFRALRMEFVRTQSIDTPPEVEQQLLRRYREIGPAGRLAAALELNAALEELALAGIRARHGRTDEREEKLRLFALRLDRDQMVSAFGWDPDLEGR
jgi:hypothetical protein